LDSVLYKPYGTDCHAISTTYPPQQDYQTYVSRKAQKRQSLIVSLSDHNQEQLRELQRQREELARDYEEKRAGQTQTSMTPAS